MTFDEYDGKRYSLDDEQKVDARQALGCGLSVQQAAQHFGLSESELRTELGMPQWKSETSGNLKRPTIGSERCLIPGEVGTRQHW